MIEPLKLHQAYKRIFDSSDGLILMQDLESRGFFMASTIGSTPERTAYNEGRRSLVLHVKHMANPANFVRLAEEEDHG